MKRLRTNYAGRERKANRIANEALMCQYLIRGSGAGGARISRIQELRLFSALGIHCDGTARTSCSSIPGCTCSVHSNATLVALPRGCCTYSVHSKSVAHQVNREYHPAVSLRASYTSDHRSQAAALHKTFQNATQFIESRARKQSVQSKTR